MLNRKAAILFENWEEALIWSTLDGYMGNMTVNDENNPISAIIDIGDFCFCAGVPDKNLIKQFSGFKLLIPKDKDWELLIESYFGKRVEKRLRYAIKKEPEIFCKSKLNEYVNNLDSRFEVKMFDKDIFTLAKNECWSQDLVSQYKDYNDFQSQAIGAAILYQGMPVAGASSYAVYKSGIEIEIDTMPEYRNLGLATVCGAKLIIECLNRNLYPSWDAHDLRSVHLAEKLGYHLSHPYTVYELNDIE